MTSKTAATLSSHDETSPPLELRDTDQISPHNLYRLIGDGLSVAEKHKSLLPDTASLKRDITGIFPEKLPSPQEARYSFYIMQEWEGYVVSINSETFTARLRDVTKNRTTEDEEADFLLEDLEDADRLRISQGAIFRWIVGYRRSWGGTKDRSSRIVFRNLPAWTKKDIENNQREAAKLASELNAE